MTTAQTEALADPAMIDPEGSVSDLEESLVNAMLRTSRVMLGLAVRSLNASPLDITLPQFRTLVILSQGRSYCLADLAQSMNVNPSTATRMCDRLVRKGLIERSREDADRRVVSLVASAAGREIVDTVMRFRREEIRTLALAIAPDQRQVLLQALDLICEVAGEPSDDLYPWGWSETAPA